MGVLDTRNRNTPDRQLYVYSQFSCMFALFFWGWAGLNTIKMKEGMMDLGVISFATVGMTSIYFLVNKGKNPTKSARICSLLSHLFVSANYALGVLYALNIVAEPLYRFGTYCVIFLLLWLGLAVYSWRLITSVIVDEILQANHDNR